MEKRTIQEQRMRGYFIEATKALLKGEGLRSVSVRNIADRAGYSYATLYNYFKDIKELIFICVEDFQNECSDFVEQETSKTVQGIPKIKAITTAYIKYFVQYPGIFDLFYLEKINDIGQKQPTVNLICTFLDRLCAKEWDYSINAQQVTVERRGIVQAALNSVVIGLLLLYLNRHWPASYNEFVQKTNTLLTILFV